MKNYIGVLGDPAKSELYTADFFRLLDWDEHSIAFHLLGASENNISRKQYKAMYNRFDPYLNDKKFKPIPNLSRKNDNSYRSRIGLFPSSTSHLIKGPSFSFAPYPVNSSSKYLKFKSNFLQFLLKPFLPFTLRKLAYVPLGGKAAQKTQAEGQLDTDDLINIFKKLRIDNKFDWYYLEAGSGEEILNQSLITQIMISQLPFSLEDLYTSSKIEAGTRVIIPYFIYGGGIRTIKDIDRLLKPEKNIIKLIPQIVIIGNISEEDIDTSYQLVNLAGEYNESPTVSANTLQVSYNCT